MNIIDHDDDPREERARRLLHSTPVEQLTAASGTFDALRAGARRRRRRRNLAAGGLASVAAAAAIVLVVVLAPSPNSNSSLRETTNGQTTHKPSASPRLRLPRIGGLPRPLIVAGLISLGIPTKTAVLSAEAPDGTVFYAPKSATGEQGNVVPGTPGTSIVRVIDGNTKPAIAEHVPGRVIGLAADQNSLFVATPTQIIRYLRSTGDQVHSWPLLTNAANEAQLVPVGPTLYVTAGFQCDFCGLNPDTLLVLNLTTGVRQTLSTNVWPNRLVADTAGVYYSTGGGHLVRTTATGVTTPSALSAQATIDELTGGDLVTTVTSTSGKRFWLELVNTQTLAVTSRRRINSRVASYAGTSLGTITSDGGCGPSVAATTCADGLGQSVSVLDLRTGNKIGTDGLADVSQLLGPKPAAITAPSSGYELARLR
jgi:hypothetical protein